MSSIPDIESIERFKKIARDNLVIRCFIDTNPEKHSHFTTIEMLTISRAGEGETALSHIEYFDCRRNPNGIPRLKISFHCYGEHNREWETRLYDILSGWANVFDPSDKVFSVFVKGRSSDSILLHVPYVMQQLGTLRGLLSMKKLEHGISASPEFELVMIRFEAFLDMMNKEWGNLGDSMRGIF